MSPDDGSKQDEACRVVHSGTHEEVLQKMAAAVVGLTDAEHRRVAAGFPVLQEPVHQHALRCLGVVGIRGDDAENGRADRGILNRRRI